MHSLLTATRTLTIRFLDYCLGTRVMPLDSPGSSSHRHWDRAVRAWR